VACGAARPRVCTPREASRLERSPAIQLGAARAADVDYGGAASMAPRVCRPARQRLGVFVAAAAPASLILSLPIRACNG